MADQNDPLESFFQASRDGAEAPSEALLRRIEADAFQEIARRAPPAPSKETKGRALLGAIGGWRVGAGLATAALTGVVLGVSLPAGLGSIDVLALTQSGYGGAEFAPGYGFDLLEDG